MGWMSNFPYIIQPWHICHVAFAPNSIRNLQGTPSKAQHLNGRTWPNNDGFYGFNFLWKPYLWDPRNQLMQWSWRFSPHHTLMLTWHHMFASSWTITSFLPIFQLPIFFSHSFLIFSPPRWLPFFKPAGAGFQETQSCTLGSLRGWLSQYFGSWAQLRWHGGRWPGNSRRGVAARRGADSAIPWGWGDGEHNMKNRWITQSHSSFLTLPWKMAHL